MKLLELLRDEAVSLAESELPSAEELRPLVGALANRLERLEQELLGELKPAPPKPAPEPPAQAEQVAPGSEAAPAAPTAAPDAAAAPASAAPSDLEQARQELIAAQEAQLAAQQHVDALEKAQASATS